MPFFKPLTSNDLSLGPAKLGLLLSGIQMTLYPVIGDPPFEIGGLQLIIAEPTPGIPVTPRTDDGGPAPGAVGVTGVVVGGFGVPPTAFIATTVNVTDVPAANPVSVAVNTLPTVTGFPTEGVTVYPVIAEPPFESGASQETVAEFAPATTVTFLGAPGTVIVDVGVTGVVVGGLGVAPMALIAVTVNVTAVPLANPVIVADKTLPTVTGFPIDGVIM